MGQSGTSNLLDRMSVIAFFDARNCQSASGPQRSFQTGCYATWRQLCALHVVARPVRCQFLKADTANQDRDRGLMRTMVRSNAADSIFSREPRRPHGRHARLMNGVTLLGDAVGPLLRSTLLWGWVRSRRRHFGPPTWLPALVAAASLSAVTSSYVREQALTTFTMWGARWRSVA
jgi:hypothetical protein